MPSKRVLDSTTSPTPDRTEPDPGPEGQKSAPAPAAEPARRGLFSRIVRGKVKRPRRCMIYGQGGIGKSSWSAQAPGAIFLPTEDGLDNIDCARFPLLPDYHSVLAAIGELFTEKHDYQTVVLDSLDWLERMIHHRVALDSGKESLEDIGFGKGYVFAIDYWREVLEGFQALRNERGMAVILIAHAKIEKFRSPDSDSYDRYQPACHRSATAVLSEWVDEIFFAKWETEVAQEPEPGDKRRSRGVGTGRRLCYTVERPSHVAKNRLDLEPEIELDYAVYAKAQERI